MNLKYPFQYQRRKTREVRVGDLLIGGENPIRLQSMLTSETTLVDQCFQEIRELNEVNCELIRITIPSVKDLEAVPKIRRRMKEEGIQIPLIADIHFKASLAIEACELFEKVRINPGNYSDKPKNSRFSGEASAFEEGKERIRELITPLVKQLKKYNRSLRIGVNQGSLSMRMMESFGDSPLGMVESALEMISLFEEQEFYQMIVSLKSSNPFIVQKAYRLLVERLPEVGSVPLHLGVTEAGFGEMARVKSITGIGSLLSDGIGDTIRVSLTEPSHKEILFARDFLSSLSGSFIKTKQKTLEKKYIRLPIDTYRFQNKNRSWDDTEIGGARPLKLGIIKDTDLPQLPMSFTPDFTYQKEKGKILVGKEKKSLFHLQRTPVSSKEFEGVEGILMDFEDPVFSIRNFFQQQKEKNTPTPPCGILFNPNQDDPYLFLSQLSTLLLEGYLDFILISEGANVEDLTLLLYLLQATRIKLFFTDYIACPSCGRTLFDLQSTTQKIKERTDHLKGVKIAVMGCIVNGPGEMADADFGYVGSNRGKIDLYLGKEKVRRGINEEKAVDELILLIKEQNMWMERDDSFRENQDGH